MFLFAGTSKGAFMSRDGGISWADIKLNVSSWFIYPELPVYAFNYSDNDIFVATPAGLYSTAYNYKADDCELGWNINNNGMPGFPKVNAILLKDNVLYSGTESGVYCSSDNGYSWNPINNGLNDLSINVLIKNKNDIIAGTEKGGIYVLKQNKDSWESLDQGLTNKPIYSIVINDAKMFAGTDDGVFSSNDSGHTWYKINAGLSDNKIYALELSDDKLYAGTVGSGLWYLPSKPD